MEPISPWVLGVTSRASTWLQRVEMGILLASKRPTLAPPAHCPGVFLGVTSVLMARLGAGGGECLSDSLWAWPGDSGPGQSPGAWRVEITPCIDRPHRAGPLGSIWPVPSMCRESRLWEVGPRGTSNKQRTSENKISDNGALSLPSWASLLMN